MPDNSPAQPATPKPADTPANTASVTSTSTVSNTSEIKLPDVPVSGLWSFLAHSIDRIIEKTFNRDGLVGVIGIMCVMTGLGGFIYATWKLVPALVQYVELGGNAMTTQTALMTKLDKRIDGLEVQIADDSRVSAVAAETAKKIFDEGTKPAREVVISVASLHKKFDSAMEQMAKSIQVREDTNRATQVIADGQKEQIRQGSENSATLKAMLMVLQSTRSDHPAAEPPQPGGS